MTWEALRSCYSFLQEERPPINPSIPLSPVQGHFTDPPQKLWTLAVQEA